MRGCVDEQSKGDQKEARAAEERRTKTKTSGGQTRKIAAPPRQSIDQVSRELVSSLRVGMDALLDAVVAHAPWCEGNGLSWSSEAFPEWK